MKHVRVDCQRGLVKETRSLTPTEKKPASAARFNCVHIQVLPDFGSNHEHICRLLVQKKTKQKKPFMFLTTSLRDKMGEVVSTYSRGLQVQTSGAAGLNVLDVFPFRHT